MDIFVFPDVEKIDGKMLNTAESKKAKAYKISPKTKYIERNTFISTDYYHNKGNWVDNVLYIDNCLIKAPGYLDEYGISIVEPVYSIKPGTRIVADAAFAENGSHLEVTMPNTVKYIGDEAFRNCMNLRKITLSNNLETIGKKIFAQCFKLFNVNLENTVITEIPVGAFRGCEELVTIDIPLTVKAIKKLAFSRTGLKQVCIPTTVTELGDAIFYDCCRLKQITVNATVDFIPESFSADCPRLKKVLLNGNISKICNSAFENTVKLEEINLGQIQMIGKKSFLGCESLKHFTFNDKIKEIKEECFSGCKKLKDIVINNPDIQFGAKAFSHCTNLNTLFLPLNLSLYDQSVFENCNNISTVILHKDTEIIYEYEMQEPDNLFDLLS